MRPQHTPVLFLSLLLFACGADDSDTADASVDCDGNGEWMEDHGHCHCDDGYDMTADGTGCETDGSDGSEGGDSFELASWSFETELSVP